jgi:hypothetical protein
MFAHLSEGCVAVIKKGPDLEVQGKTLDHEYSTGEGGVKAVEAFKEVVPPA